MQRLGSPSVLPTLAGTSAQLWECQTRHYRKQKWWKPRKWGPRRRTAWPTFDISSLLLDLDAEGAKGVRAFDPQLDGEPESGAIVRERELQPIKHRVAQFERGYQERQSAFQDIAADKFNPLHISDFDLLAAALFDPLNTPSKTTAATTTATITTRTGMLDSILDANGIPRTIRNDTSDTIAYMLRRREALNLPESLSPRPEDKTLFSTALSRCATFAEIDRLVARIIHIPKGCETLSTLSDELHTSLTQISEVKPIQLLSLLNNIFINFDRYGLHMSSKLLDLGISTSLKCQAIITVQQYIERKLEHGHLEKSMIDSILDQMLQTSIASTSFTSSDPTSRLTTLFSLLTGYVPGEDQPTVSIRSLISPDSVNGLRLYIRCLAGLGAYRTIWHEWHAIDSTSEDINSITKSNSGFSESSYFVTAMLEALRKNERLRDLAQLPEFVDVTGQPREDCQLDLLAISRSADILSWPESRKENNDSTHARWIQWEQLQHIFKETQIQKTLPALQAFLIQTKSFL
ncbi:hypothetical protein F4859DRAFT_475519 [Xylaria cf. heliscus]|nr:hypothetical protein F4859DRAFT_475519 [Xylaria cf. heliscus]